MKIDFTKELVGFDGKPIELPTEDGQGSENWTLGRVCTEALMAMFPDEKDLSGSEKLNRHYLASKIHRAKRKVKLTAEDISLLKKLVAKMFGPRLVGPAWCLLEGKPMVEELDEEEDEKPAEKKAEPIDGTT